jgi:hypothetical protein
MKIDGTMGVTATAPVRRRRTHGDGHGAFDIAMEEEAEVSTSAMMASPPLMDVASLIALQQQQPPPTEDKTVTAEGYQHYGETMLRVLDSVQQGMLGEGITAAAMEELQHLVEEELRLVGEHPELREAVDGIRVRAAVELAKMQVARAAKS